MIYFQCCPFPLLRWDISYSTLLLLFQSKATVADCAYMSLFPLEIPFSTSFRSCVTSKHPVLHISQAASVTMLEPAILHAAKMLSEVDAGRIVETTAVSFFTCLLIFIEVPSAAVKFARSSTSSYYWWRCGECITLLNAVGCFAATIASCVWLGVRRRIGLPDKTPFMFWQFSAAFYPVASEVFSQSIRDAHKFNSNRFNKH